MNNNRRRNFRPRIQKNNFRRRSGSLNSNNSNSLNNNGNMNFNRNGSMNNIHNVEKTMQKYQQLAKDAQSNGDPVLSQNYLQHADHFTRILSEQEILKNIDVFSVTDFLESLQEWTVVARETGGVQMIPVWKSESEPSVRSNQRRTIKGDLGTLDKIFQDLELSFGA